MDGVPDAPWVSRSLSPLGRPAWSCQAVHCTAISQSSVRREKRMRREHATNEFL